MTVCALKTCTNPILTFPSIWLTSTNPSVECCSEACAMSYRPEQSVEPAPEWASETITRRLRWRAQDAAEARARDEREAS